MLIFTFVDGVSGGRNRHRLCISAYAGACFLAIGGTGFVFSYVPRCQDMVSHCRRLAAVFPCAFLPVGIFVMLPVSVSMTEGIDALSFGTMTNGTFSCLLPFCLAGSRNNGSPTGPFVGFSLNAGSTAGIGTFSPVTDYIMEPDCAFKVMACRAVRSFHTSVTDRAVADLNTGFLAGSRNRYSPAIDGMVTHILLIAARTFMPMLGVIVFPILAIKVSRRRLGTGFKIFANLTNTLFPTNRDLKDIHLEQILLLMRLH